MSKIDYRSINARNRERYLYPEDSETSLLDVLAPAASYALFFTPLMRNIGKAIGGGIKKTATGKGVKSAIKGAKSGGSSFGGRLNEFTSGIKDTGMSGVREGFSSFSENFTKNYGNRITSLTDIMGRGARYLGREVVKYGPKAASVLNSALRNTSSLAIGAGILGAGIAINSQSGVRPIADVGMGYPAGTEWVKTSKKGLRPGHLGATGDLVFAMRGAR